MTPQKQQKQSLQECPKCHSLKVVKDAQGFRCLSCNYYFPQARLGNVKKEVEVER